MVSGMFDLSGKTAVVTGGAGGIGRAIANGLADAGANVVVTSRGLARLEEVAEGIRAKGVKSLALACDITDVSSVESMLQGVLGEFPLIDILVNAAGIAIRKPAETFPIDEWQLVLDINTRGTFICCQAVGREMIKSHSGRIINLSSVRGRYGLSANYSAYCASKGAVLMLTKSLAVDYGPDKIRVNCLCPGITDTPLLRFHVGHTPDPEAHLKQRLQRVPTAEMLYPEDMGRAAAFLCSDEARGITGASLVVDGGYLACAEFFR